MKIQNTIFLILICLFSLSLNKENLYNNDEQLYAFNRLEILYEHIQENPELKKGLELLEEYIHKQVYQQNNNNKQANPIYCIACKNIIKQIYNWQKVKLKFNNFLTALATYECNINLDLYPLNVCTGVSMEQIPVLTDSFWEHYFSPDFICPLLTLCKRKYKVVNVDELVQDILKDKPQNVEKIIPEQKNILKVLQLSDLHTDYEYITGNSANCPDPTCCRKGSYTKDGEQTVEAGYWGSIAYCDVPTRTLEKGIEYIKNYLADDIDFAIWTGDNTSHNIWEQSKEQNLENTVEITELLQKNLPNTRVFPMFGNHEAFPCNLYDFEGDHEKYLLEQLGGVWEKWIGKEATENFMEDSYYEYVDESLNLKIIALNSQAGDAQNQYLVRDPTDPGQMLEKLRQSLQESEDNNNQPVWLFQHIPVGRGTRNIWSRVYNALIDRYSHIIRAQISGHTHADEIGVFYDGENPEIINNVKFVAPSFTTYHLRKPQFRVYEFDKDTLQILNYRQYRLDLDYWNKFTDPNTELLWEEAYDFLSEYNLPNIYDLQNFQTFREQVGNDLDTYNKYYFNHKSGVAEKQTSININYYCQMLPLKKDQFECEGKEFIPYLSDILAGPWLEKK